MPTNAIHAVSEDGKKTRKEFKGTKINSRSSGKAKIANGPFAARLHKIMMDRGLTDSDLAKLIWGTRIDPATNYEVARNRDRVGVYLAGTGKPNRKTLKLMADKLNLPVTELMPEIEEKIASLPGAVPNALTDLGGGKCRLQVDKVLPTVLATKITLMIAEHEAEQK